MFFFFKQKTAYEMRISDWSSDVCSSDLIEIDHHQIDRADRMVAHRRGVFGIVAHAEQPAMHLGVERLDAAVHHLGKAGEIGNVAHREPGVAQRSEEHTSELQSLMRISYAVFCLKKKNKTNTNKTTQ